jgi:hypothetical protein
MHLPPTLPPAQVQVSVQVIQQLVLELPHQAAASTWESPESPLTS